MSGKVTDQEFIALFGDRVSKVIGPAYTGFLQEASFRPVASLARLLSSSQDEESLRLLYALCDEQEWEHSDIHIGQHPTFGLFVSNRLLAVANYRMEAEGVAAPGLIVDPGFRGHRYGKSVLSAATEHGLSRGLLMLYQTLLLNKPAITASQSLGYEPYATHLAARLG
ncbi:hypothetical protein IAD21_00243 [Abditibacteriota bacterium]|nr:hypothetical protein IAD21_00243 [Abditibacteriota bacterium]